jgi:cell division protein FtsB
VESKLKFAFVLNLWNKYKYWLIGLFAITWMTVFDSNNFIELIKLRREVSDLEEKRDYYKTEIIHVRKEEKELFSNVRNLEKFAREKYLMKKDNEDLFIIVEE